MQAIKRARDPAARPPGRLSSSPLLVTVLVQAKAMAMAMATAQMVPLSHSNMSNGNAQSLKRFTLAKRHCVSFKLAK